MNAITQALVWTTVAGLMYAVWLNKRESNGSINFGLPFQVRGVTNLLHTMWVVFALGMIVSLIILTLATRG